jgi:Terminase small subunit
MDARVSKRDEFDTRERRLTVRQLAFVREYMKDHNATQAYIRAGYSRNGAGESAYKLLKQTQVSRLIFEKERELALATEADEAWVVRQLKENTFRSIEAGELGTVTRSLELIGKHIGMFVDRSDLRVMLEQIEAVELRVVDPVIDAEYQIDDKRRKD